MRILVGTLILSVFLSVSLFAQSKGTSIVIHDNTTAANGGENATQSLRNEIESALQNQKPCVDTMDDQDIRDLIQSEREKNLLEGGDPGDFLKQIGTMMGASYAMSVSSTPGPGGSATYTVFVLDPKTGKTVARQSGTDAKQIADSIVKQLGSSLADDCKPHWTGTIRYEYSNEETKVTNDAGAMRAAARNLKRTTTQSMTMTSSVNATLLPPNAAGASSANKSMARVWMKAKTLFEKKSDTSGELLCRLPGRNPFWKGFTESYSETVTQLGGGSETLPVFITLDNDGDYRISVSTPSGTLLSKIETERSATNCSEQSPPPQKDAQSSPEQKIQASSFDVEGRIDSKDRDSLSGSKTMPDGKTKISWSLRLAKPKGKN